MAAINSISFVFGELPQKRRSKSSTKRMHVIPHKKLIMHTFMKSGAGDFQRKAIIVFEIVSVELDHAIPAG